MIPHVDKLNCAKHLLGNLKAASCPILDTVFWRLTDSESVVEYQRIYSELSFKTQTYLDKTNKAQWVRYAIVASGAANYGKRTSNGVESENSRFKTAREQQAYQCIDSILMLMVTIVRAKRKHAETRVADGDTLTPFAAAEFKKNVKLAQQCKVTLATDDIAYVSYDASLDHQRRTVDMENLTCTCLKWQQNKRPCYHAFGAALLAGKLSPATSQDWIIKSYGTCWFAEAYLAGYENSAIMLPCIDNMVPDGTTNAAACVTTAGRPKKKRMRPRHEGGNHGKQHKCSTCGQLGHHYQNCPAPTLPANVTMV